jgi:HNH endonuclease
MSDDFVKCELCPPDSNVRVSVKHLRETHDVTYNRYLRMGYKLNPHQDPPHSYGPDHWNWNGGHVNSQGYRIVYRNGRRMTEHRAIAEDMIGRPLLLTEAVHHIDGNRLNNDPSNLQVMTRAEHDKMKEGTRAFSHVTPDCEEAARFLIQSGWSRAKVRRALRIHHSTLKRWLG